MSPRFQKLILTTLYYYCYYYYYYFGLSKYVPQAVEILKETQNWVMITSPHSQDVANYREEDSTEMLHQN